MDNSQNSTFDQFQPFDVKKPVPEPEIFGGVFIILCLTFLVLRRRLKK